MKIRYIIFLIVAAATVGGIAFAPATLIEAPANRALAPNAVLSVTSGNLWSGRATLSIFPIANPITIPLNWRFDPAAALRLRAGFYVNADSPAITGNTRIGAGFGSIECRDTDLKIDGALAPRFYSMLGLLGPRGGINIIINDGGVTTPYQATNGTRSLDGKLIAKINNLTLQSLSPRALGSYELAINFKNTNAEYAFVNMNDINGVSGVSGINNVNNTNNALKFDGAGALSWDAADKNARQFSYRGFASAPRESAMLLAPLLAVGKPTLDGRIKIDYSTKW